MKTTHGLVLAMTFGLMAVTGRAQDPLSVAPGMYQLLFENERIRVIQVSFGPGQEIAPHSHPDHAVYVAKGGQLEISKAASTNTVDLREGQVLWIPAEKHWAKNVGSGEVRLVVTELKEPAPAKP